MNLTTNYLGLTLAHPILPGASPLVDDLDTVRRLEDAGAPAIVMHSLFEEQIVAEQLRNFSAVDLPKEQYAESLTYLPEPGDFTLGPQEYLEQVRRIKQAVGVPVIASLNGTTLGGWLDYARQIAAAGADALELNVYELPVDPAVDGASIEQRTLEMVRQVRAAVNIPVAVKLSPFYTALAHFAGQLEQAGADGLVLFNRLYQPDIDPGRLEMTAVSPVGLGELPLRLRWLGILRGQLRGSLAATGGVVTARDAIKALMAGADVVEMVSALLLHGPGHLGRVLESLRLWMEEFEYASLADLRGSMSLERCPDPSAYHRANYMRTLLSWRM